MPTRWTQVGVLTAPSCFANGDHLACDGDTIVCAGPARKTASTGPQGPTSVYVWSASSGSQLAKLVGHTDSVRCVALDVGRDLVASGGLDGTVRLWQLSTGECLAVLRGHVGHVYGLSLGCGLLASGSTFGLKIWSTETHVCLASHRHTQDVMSVKITETCVLSTSEDGSAMAWPLGEGGPLAVLDHLPRGPVSSVSAHGRRAVTSQANTVQFWNLDTFELASTCINVADAPVYSVHLRDDMLVTGSWNPEPCAKVWKVSTVNSRWNLPTMTVTCTGYLRGHGTRDVLGVASSDGFVATVAEMDRIVIWRSLLAVGTMVEAHSLVGRADLNGQRGVVSSFVQSSGRYAVWFDGGNGGALNVKPSNLSVVQQPDDEEEEDEHVRAENFLHKAGYR